MLPPQDSLFGVRPDSHVPRTHHAPRTHLAHLSPRAKLQSTGAEARRQKLEALRSQEARRVELEELRAQFIEEHTNPNSFAATYRPPSAEREVRRQDFETLRAESVRRQLAGGLTAKYREARRPMDDFQS